mmetsp:Transcript_65742/g.208067  ORF Transcript_65742/g.208067 Transcript_65742/m.208067 type:complete len:472 (-) Transcript_65742:41-1456(-)|eukprot:CAMPEP_0182911714 /NCGR_PEP_ID=MMETSP0034_2-20130328/37093_1 /TAXON_ID=156128 /ORGANISM="Nephroselmis pyriformis, Strain CCMP717" /LENGTH=471 /DNA_ID=CAMNT_0025048293 /DNA_START=132 /DNA_END=1547 /DNA_ORIENTATION=+
MTSSSTCQLLRPASTGLGTTGPLASTSHARAAGLAAVRKPSRSLRMKLATTAPRARARHPGAPPRAPMSSRGAPGPLRSVEVGNDLDATAVSPTARIDTPFKHVKHIPIDPAHFEGFYASFDEVFPAGSAIHDYDSQEAPGRAAEAEALSFALAARWLPPAVVAEISTFLHTYTDPAADAPVALLLSGIPLDDPDTMPPTPNYFNPEGVRVPVAEAWTLGLGRLMGHPYNATLGMKTHRGGLVKDMVPNPEHLSDGFTGLLGMHRDFPGPLFGQHVLESPFEPDGFVLVAARGDSTHTARTMIVDNRALVAAADPADLALLREHRITFTSTSKDGEVTPMAGGRSTFWVEGPEDDPLVSLFDSPPDTSDGKTWGVESPTGGEEAAAAFIRVQNLAEELADFVDLQPGDCLLLDNVRCNHGRTGYKPRGDGTDRWLVKTNVTSRQMWSRPGDYMPGLTAYPGHNPVVEDLGL